MKTVALLLLAAFSLPACMVVPVAEPVAVERHHRHFGKHHHGHPHRHHRPSR